MQEVNRLGIRVYRQYIECNDYYGSYIYTSIDLKFRRVNSKWFGIRIIKRYGKK
jgi:hypothetical protein